LSDSKKNGGGGEWGRIFPRQKEGSLKVQSRMKGGEKQDTPSSRVKGRWEGWARLCTLVRGEKKPDCFDYGRGQKKKRGGEKKKNR